MKKLKLFALGLVLAIAGAAFAANATQSKSPSSCCISGAGCCVPAAPCCAADAAKHYAGTAATYARVLSLD